MYNSICNPVKSLQYLAAVLVILGCTTLGIAGDKKSGGGSAAPAHPSGGGGAAPHPSGGGGGGAAASHPGGGAASASHGPTTSSASHGPTTSSASHGPTTSTASHGPTTSSPGGAKTTTTTTTAGSHGTTTSNATGHTTTTTANAGHAGTTGATGATAGGSRGSTNAVGAHNTAGAAGVSHGGSAAGTAGGKGSFGGRPAPAGSHEVHTASGNSVRTRPNGKTADVHDAKRNMDIHHGLNGNRRVSAERADHSRVVAERGGHGYVERGYHYHGHEYGRRSYYYGGRYYNHYYRGYYYGGYYMNAYAPAYYYGPGFYGWAYNPWPAPIVYSWGWAGNPWYGYYGGYFNPYPVYPSAAYWLTDYLVSASLAAAYQEAVDAQVEAAKVPPGGQPVLDQQTKDMISEEVKRQIALENSEAQAQQQNQEVDPASSGIARMLSDNQTHVFIAGSSLDVVQTSGQECAISQGDVLEVTSAPPADATAATATVLCSKGGKECPKSSQVSVAYTDLQEMQNHMRETIDQGMGDLQAKQGQNGIPAAPPSAKAPPVQSSFVAAAPPPEENVASDIKQEAQQADQAEQEVAKDVPPPNPAMDGAATPTPAAASSAAPVTVSQGQSVDEVTAALGAPKSVVKLGTKEIYVYQDMKVTFKGGKVSDVQ